MSRHVTLAESEEIRKKEKFSVDAKLLRIRTSLFYLQLIYAVLDEKGALGKANERALEVFKKHFPDLESVRDLNHRLDQICDELEPEKEGFTTDYLKLAERALNTDFKNKEPSQSHPFAIICNQAAFLGINPRQTISYLRTQRILKILEGILCIFGGVGTIVIVCGLLDKIPNIGTEAELSASVFMGQYLGTVGVSIGKVIDFAGGLVLGVTFLALFFVMPFVLWGVLGQRVSKKILEVLIRRFKAQCPEAQ